jgi:hypothetical protein
MKKQLKILASAFAGLMLVTSLAGCDLSAVKNLFPASNQHEQESLDEQRPKIPAVRYVHDFEDLYGEKDWKFYNLVHHSEKEVCGEIVDDGSGNHVMKIIGEGDKWEGVEFNSPRYLGMQANKITLKVTSSKEIEDLRFSLEYAKHHFMECTVDIPVGTNEIELVFEDDFMAIFSFIVKTKTGLYGEIFLDDIRAIEHVIN